MTVKPEAYTIALRGAITLAYTRLEELRDQLQTELDSMPRDRAKWSDYADQLRAALGQLDLIVPPPKFSEQLEYLGTTELTCYDYGWSLSMRRDGAIDLLRAAIVVLEERAGSFREYSAVPGPDVPRPSEHVGPWTPQDYDQAAVELEGLIDRLELDAKRAENTVFPWEG